MVYDILRHIVIVDVDHPVFIADGLQQRSESRKTLTAVYYNDKGSFKYNGEAQSVERVSDIALCVLEIIQPILYRRILYSRQTCLFCEVVGVIRVWQTPQLAVKPGSYLLQQLCFFCAGTENIA